MNHKESLRRYGSRLPGSLRLPSGRPGRSPLNSRRPARMPPGLGVHAAEILIRAQRPPAAPSVNISLRVLAYGAVSATGW